jgi:hypothetical protein
MHPSTKRNMRRLINRLGGPDFLTEVAVALSLALAVVAVLLDVFVWRAG